MAKKKKEKLSVYLLKESITDYVNAMKLDSGTPYKLKEDISSEGMVIVKSIDNKEGPKWQRFVGQTTQDPLESLNSKSNSAIIFIKTSGRIFAYTFGYGRALLNPDAIEDRFGLIVTINRVDAEQLRSVDIKNFELTQFQIRKQAAGITGLDTFGLDIRRDILSAVAGTPTDNRIGYSLAGRDSLVILTDTKPNQLKELCDELLVAYGENKYKERFGWIDQLKPVKNNVLKCELNQSLVDDINKNNIDDIDLCQPEIIDPLRISGYRYPNSDNSGLELALDIRTFVKALPDTEKPISVDYLKNHYISYYYEDDTSASGHWSVFKCLTTQKKHNRKTYVLNEGDWFEVAQDLVKDVDIYVKSIKKSDLKFPENIWGDEEIYNKETAKTLPDTLLQDQCFVFVGGPHGKVEPCDLLTKSNKIIHVKRKTCSATLSHLYAQAQVSADLLRRDKKFRIAWQKNIKEKDLSFQRVIQPSQFNRDHYEIVFVILTAKPSNIPEKLPFFARLHLMHTVQQLRDYGYMVAISGVLEKPNKKKKVKKNTSKK